MANSSTLVRRGEWPNKSNESAQQARGNGQTVINVASMDYTALLVIVLLLLIGVVMVFCAGYYMSSTREMYNYDTLYFLKKQGLFAVMGFCIMMILSSVNYRFLMRFAVPLYLVSNVLLVAVAIVGIASHGAKRWITLPVIGRFQPSEVSKVAIIIMVAYIVYKYKNALKTWMGFFFLSGIVLVTAALVFLGNLSTAIIICIIGFGMIFIASPHILRFVVAGASGVGALVMYIALFSQSFRGERFDAWLRPFDDPKGFGFQIIQSLFAIASGGLFGLGIGQSRQKSFLPEGHNDFIFAIICEELGLVGAGVVLLLFGILIWRGIRISIMAPDLFGSLVAAGSILLIASQVIINVAVVTNSIPNTGIPMPFISYGGTTLLITMALMGILLNISRYSKS